MAKRIDQIHAETSWIRKQQHVDQHQILTQVTQLNETHKMYASFIEAQNAKIESLHAKNLALRLTVNKTDNLNMMHQNIDELLRNRGYNAMGKQAEREILFLPAPSL